MRMTPGRHRRARGVDAFSTGPQVALGCHTVPVVGWKQDVHSLIAAYREQHFLWNVKSKT